MSAALRPRPLAGFYETAFWRFVDARELRLQRCERCGHWRYPPGPACPRCRSDAFAWAATAGRGRVLAWTVFHRQYFPEIPVPYAVASVRLPEGPLMIGNIVNLPIDAIRHDMPVRAAFERVAAPDGPWTLCQWEPEPGPPAP